MKILKLIILLNIVLISILVVSSFSRQNRPVNVLRTAPDTSSMDTLRKISNKAFSAGEYLKFDVNYGFVTAGEAVLKISDTLYHERKCYFVEFILNSKPFFDVFYKVRDRYYTFIDAEGMFPWRFEQHIREGGYTRDFIAEFDQINHIATAGDKKYIIPAYVQDMMSAFYFTRTIDFTGFKPGQKIHLQNFYKDSTYELDVKFKGIQRGDVDAGKFNCIIVEPMAKEGGLFKNEGRIYVWLTDDERRMPVMVTAKIAIGSVDAELVEYRGLAGPVNAKIP